MLVLIFSWSNSAVSADDLYLKQLEAEASSNTQNTATPTKSDDVLTSSEQTTRRNHFEHKLQIEKHGTFRTYELLKEEDKIKVIETYFNSNSNMEGASRLVFELYYK